MKAKVEAEEVPVVDKELLDMDKEAVIMDREAAVFINKEVLAMEKVVYMNDVGAMEKENMFMDEEALVMVKTLRTTITTFILPIGIFTRARTLTILTIWGIAIRTLTIQISMSKTLDEVMMMTSNAIQKNS